MYVKSGHDIFTFRCDCYVKSANLCLHIHMDTQNEKQYSSKLERHVIYLKAINHTPWKKREKICFYLFLGLRVTLLLSNNRKPSSVTGYELCCMTYFATKSHIHPLIALLNNHIHPLIALFKQSWQESR